MNNAPRHRVLMNFLNFVLPDIFEALGHSSEKAQMLTKSFILKIHHYAADHLAKQEQKPEVSTQTSKMTSPDDIITLLSKHFNQSDIDLQITQATYLAIDTAINRISIQVDSECWSRITGILNQKITQLKLPKQP